MADETWRDIDMEELLERWDEIIYKSDSFRQRPILSRSEAKRIEAAERNFQMLQAMMVGDFRRPQRIHWWYEEWG